MLHTKTPKKMKQKTHEKQKSKLFRRQREQSTVNTAHTDRQLILLILFNHLD